MKTNISSRHKTIHINLKRPISNRTKHDKKSARTIHSTSSGQNTRVKNLSINEEDHADISQTKSSYILSSESQEQFKRENVDSSKLINLDFSLTTKGCKQSTVYPYIEIDHPVVVLKKKRKPIPFYWKVIASVSIVLLIVCIILTIVLPLLLKSKFLAPNITTIQTTTTILPQICSLSTHNACSIVIFEYLNSLYVPPSSWTHVSCCYIAPISNQLTFEIAVQVDDSGNWRLDDISARQTNGELISNGGFESNITNWTLTTYPNVSSSIIEADSLSLNANSGLAYLYISSANARSYLRQTFSVIPGENILISFFWDYLPAFGFPMGISELIIKLT